MAEKLTLEFLPSGAEGNAIVTPSGAYAGAYFTLIGGGNEADQNALGAKLIESVNVSSALSDVIAVMDSGNSVTLHFSEIKSAKAFRDGFSIANVSTGTVVVGVDLGSPEGDRSAFYRVGEDGRFEDILADEWKVANEADRMGAKMFDDPRSQRTKGCEDPCRR